MAPLTGSIDISNPAMRETPLKSAIYYQALRRQGDFSAVNLRVP